MFPSVTCPVINFYDILNFYARRPQRKDYKSSSSVDGSSVFKIRFLMQSVAVNQLVQFAWVVYMYMCLVC